MANGQGERISHVFVGQSRQSEVDGDRPLHLFFIGAPGAGDQVLACVGW